MRYLSDLRIHPSLQGSTLLARGFRLLKNEVFRPGEWAQTLVLEDNLRALEILASRRCGLPEYRPSGRYISWLLPRQHIRPAPGIKVRRATVGDIGAMQALWDECSSRRCFSGVYDFSNLGQPFWDNLLVGDFLVASAEGRIKGMMGLWDQSGFQRLRILGYPSWLGMIRPFRNIFANVALPPAGQVLPIHKATAIACEDDDPVVLRSMLATALAEDKGCMIFLGFSASDPLLAAMKGLQRRMSRGCHFLVGWDGEPPVWKEPFVFDPARI